MEEIKSVYDTLNLLSFRQVKIDRAVDEVTASHEKLAQEQEGFADVMAAAERLMAANPKVEAVDAGNGKVLARMPSGAVVILNLTPWYMLEAPAPAPSETAIDDGDDVPMLPANEAAIIMRRIDNDPVFAGPDLTRNGNGFTLSQNAHDRIQAGCTSNYDVDAMARQLAWGDTFGEPKETGD